MRRSQVIRRTMHKPICPRVGSVFAASLRTGLGEGSNLGLSPAGTPNVRVWAEYAVRGISAGG